MKRTIWNRIFSLILAMVMLVSVPMGVLADEIEGVVGVETTAGNTEAVDVTITITETPASQEPAQQEPESQEPEAQEPGAEEPASQEPVNVQTSVVAEDFVTESGMIVDYQGTSEKTTDADGDITGTEDISYTVENADGTYSAEGGSERDVEKVAPETTVDVPLTEGSSETAVGDEAGTSETTGDEKASPEDGTYDYTTETVTEQGEVTVTTTEITTEVLPSDETTHGYETELDHVRSEATPDADNDLFIETASRVDVEAVEANPPAEATDGYEYVYLGSENSSEYFAAYLFTAPQYENEKPVYTIDGVDYYTGRAGMDKDTIENNYAGIHRGFKVDGLYIDGEKVSEEEHVMIWGAVQQFLLQNTETGELTTTYCVDQRTFAHEGFSYNIENIEDADYYDDEAAAHIRTIAQNGYWGTNEGTGSLDAMKDMMRNAKDEDGNALFTEEEIALLNDGVAMTATQYAIWNYSNEGDNVKYLNVNYIHSGEDMSEEVLSYGKMGDVPEEKKPAADLIFKLSNYLIHMEPEVIEEPTTANTVITAENAVKEMSVTVVEKAEDHVNNQDDDTDNDAYVTDLSFALVVTPSTENGDDMIVKIVSNGKVIKEARIAGNAREGETLETLEADENGNYTIKNITLIEGNQEFNITLEGIQNLEEGVYLYSSEIGEVKGEETTSQTMLGLAGGEHAVNVSMTIAFELDVQDEVVATERVWREEHTKPADPPVPHDDTPEEDPEDPRMVVRFRQDPVEEPEEPAVDGEIVIPEEPVPMADAPLTGDPSMILVLLCAASTLGMAALAPSRRKEEE